MRGGGPRQRLGQAGSRLLRQRNKQSGQQIEDIEGLHKVTIVTSTLKPTTSPSGQDSSPL